MTAKYRSTIGLLLLSLVALASVSCLNEGDKTIVLVNQSSSDNGGGTNTEDTIPANPYIVDPNTDIPNIQYATEEENGEHYLILYMTGIQKPNGQGWLRLVGTSGGKQQNIWSSIDNTPKALTVYNTIDGQDQSKLMKNDLVFLIDNSSSMAEEANVIARDVLAWAQKLSSQLDMRFGCVGYDGTIRGAIDLTSYDILSTYLDRNTGTDITVGFSGSNSAELESKAANYSFYSDIESSMAALHFANDNFSFREDANRIYVNFTDESNFNYNNSHYSVEYLASQDNWSTSQGTIHTVFSNNGIFDEGEEPWLMSKYTGGTVLFANSAFSDISLDTLPVTYAMQNSYVIRIAGVGEFLDGEEHHLKLTIKTPENDVRAEKMFNIVVGDHLEE